MILTPIVIADAPACNTSDHGVELVQGATPTYPDSARDLGIGHVTIVVQVSVNPDGSVAKAQIYKSSSNAALDQAALRAAKASTYSPMIVNCNAQSAEIALAVNMIPQGPGNLGLAAPSIPAYVSGCANPNREATITNAVAPSVPGASRTGESVTVIVRVSVNQTGGIRWLRVVQSSGDDWVDAAVMKAAHDSTYAPRYVGCQPVSGEYLFEAQVNPHRP
jgi:TonB family protein